MLDGPCHTLVKKTRGFTLIELLVVISILSLLIALLLPALTAARDAAQRVACGSNLRQIGVGVATYQVDHGSLPISKKPNSIFWPLMYMNPQAPLSDEFQHFASDYLNARGLTHSKGWTPGTWGVFRCPAKAVRPSTDVWDVSYLSSGFMGNWYGMRYGHDADGDGIPQSKLGLTTGQNREGFDIFGYRGLYTWDHASAVSQNESKLGVYPDEARSPWAWPLFFDQSVAHTNGRPDFNSNHPESLNSLYLDGSVVTQANDPNWKGNPNMRVSNWPAWYLPYVRFGNFDHQP